VHIGRLSGTARRAVALTLAGGVVASSLVAAAPSALAQPGAHPKAEPASTAADLTGLVDPFVGTEGDHGNDLPGAQAPHGLAKVNPMTTPGRNHSGYDYAENHIAGFTNTNLDGVGGSGGGGDLLVVPTSVHYNNRPATESYAHPFTHHDEQASPGHYRVGLGALKGTDREVSEGEGTIDAEVTATTRTGLHRYTFPEGQTPQVVIDLNNNFTSRSASSIDTQRHQDGTVSLSGTFSGNFNGANYTMSYHAETEQPVKDVKTWSDAEDSTALTDDARVSGKDTGAVLTMDPERSREFGLRVTVSPISAEQAQKDQRVEVHSKTFEQVKEDTAQEWNRRLNKVNVKASVRSDPEGDLKHLFYTHLYRMFAMPVNATSTSGTYRGVDGAVHKVDDYTYYDGWGSWDDFRKYSVLAYVDPQLYRDMIQSLITRFADQASTGETDPFKQTQSVPNVRWERTPVIVADALSKGYKGFSRLDEAYPAIRALAGYYSGQELRQGYVADRPGEGVERGYDQWALAIIADSLGRKHDAATLRKQAALPMENQYKPGAWTAEDGTEVGLLNPRDAQGDFTDVDHEQFEAANLYQGTLWQYNFYGAYDMDGIIDAMGGRHAARLALSHMFGEDDPDNGKAMLHSNANEIDLQAPYLFNYVGRPSLTQKWARSIYTKPTWNRYIATGQTDGNNPSSANGEFAPPVKQKVYQLDPKGLLPTMDNDTGTMSTMFVAGALGMFPVTAGSSQYQLGSPFFDSATINYDNGRTFTVKANGVSADSFYVQDAKLNSRPQSNTWLDYSSIVGGGSLALDMANEPSDWGRDSKPAYSLSSATQDEPEKHRTVKASTDEVKASPSGEVESTVSFTLPKGHALKAGAGTDLLATRQARLVGLPDSVTATATVDGKTTVRLRLRGTLEKNANIRLELEDKALSTGQAADLVGTGIREQTPLRLSIASSQQRSLQRLVDSASLVRQGHYTANSFERLTRALERATSSLDDESASAQSLRAAQEQLSDAIDSLALDQGGFRVLQGEESDEWSGGDLKNESNSSVGNLGGVTDGSWVSYDDLDFAGDAPTSLAVRYSNKLETGTRGSKVTVHAGDRDGPVVATAALPGTGGWGTWRTVNAKVSDGESLAGAAGVTFVFSAPEEQEWVANVDWFHFAAESGSEQAPKVVQAEDHVHDSGQGLKTEKSSWNDGDVTNVGGSYDGAWLDYGTVDFGADARTNVDVHYVANASRVGKNPRIDFYLDADPRNVQEAQKLVSVPLNTTGNDWNQGSHATADLPEAVSGEHRLVAVLRAQTDADHPYVANLDSYSFLTAAADQPVDLSGLEAAIKEAGPYDRAAQRYVGVDAQVLERELATARALLRNPKATQNEVDTQRRTLLLAIDQLVPKAHRQLDVAVQRAEKLKDQRYTETSWDALQTSITRSKTILDDEHATDQELRSALNELNAATQGLRVRELAVPSKPLKATATGQGSAVTVRWEAPEDDGGSPVTGYRVRLGDRSLRVQDATERSATFSWLEPGTTHRATVMASNEVGESEASDTTNAVKSTSAKGASSGGADAGAGALSARSLEGTFYSDSWPDGKDTVVDMLRGFEELGTDLLAPNKDLGEAEPSAYNDKKMLNINHAASTKDVDRAQLDADNDAKKRVEDGMGSHLSAVYAEAMKDGDLPQTETILERVEQNVDGADAVKPVWQYDRPYVRMGLASEGGLVRDNKTGGYDGSAGQGSFPSGHTYHGYVAATTLATLLPEVGPQMLARASEYGNNRIVLGFHYPLDVMGSRILGQAVVAHRWSDPEFAQQLERARDELESVLPERCEAKGYGKSIEDCIGEPYQGLDDRQATKAYTGRMSYGFPKVAKGGQALITPKEAGSLLRSTFPDLTESQLQQVLQQTAAESGDPLDLTADGKEGWARINLAKAMSAHYRIGDDGKLKVTNYQNQTDQNVATLSGVAIDGARIDGFEPETRTYMVDWPQRAATPKVSAAATVSGADVRVKPRSVSGKAAGESGWDIRVTSANGKENENYRVLLHTTAADHTPESVEPVPDGTGSHDGGSQGGSADESSPGSSDGEGSDQAESGTGAAESSGGGHAPSDQGGDGGATGASGQDRDEAGRNDGGGLASTGMEVTAMLLGAGLVVAGGLLASTRRGRHRLGSRQ
jgi:predicted alpha-1,2-mannosidase